MLKGFKQAGQSHDSPSRAFSRARFWPQWGHWNFMVLEWSVILLDMSVVLDDKCARLARAATALVLVLGAQFALALRPLVGGEERLWVMRKHE